MSVPVTIEGHAAVLRFDDYSLANYQTFLKAKALPEKSVVYDWDTDSYLLTTHKRFAGRLGVIVPDGEEQSLPISEFLFDYQQFIVARAMEAQRFAVFADTGLGKSLMELECARQVLHLMGGKFLLMTMPQIIPQMMEMKKEFYPDLPMIHITSREDLIAWLKSDAEGVAITNYQKMLAGKGQEGIIREFRNLSGIGLDEASILKTGGGVIKWNLIKSAKGIPYKFTFTATPAPNDVMEYASQAAFLEKIQGFWDYFTKRGDGKGDWYVKPHALAAFYLFMSSWSIFMRNPARFGFADNLSSIPPPMFHDIPIQATQEQMDFAMGIFAKAGSGMFGDSSLGITFRSKLSQAGKGFVYDKTVAGGVVPIPSRKPARVAEIVKQCVEEGRQTLVWTVFDEESRLAEKACQDAGIPVKVLHGSMKEQQRLEVLEEFRSGKATVLISKAELLGFGMNFQFCTAMIFSGWDDSYERYYQAVRRAYRYGQTQTVHIFMPIVSELEGPIQENLMRKKANFEADAQAQEDAYIDMYRKEIAAWH